MAVKMEIDCLGMKCPRPIIEIAKASRKLEKGSIIKVQADDLAFESDVRAWVENAKADIISFSKEGKNVTIEIKLK